MKSGRATEVIRQLEQRSGESALSEAEWGWTTVKVETVFQVSLKKLSYESGPYWISTWGNLAGLGASKKESLSNLENKLRNVVKSATLKAEENQ